MKNFLFIAILCFALACNEDDLKEANTYYGNNTGAMDKIEELQQPEVKVIVNGHRYNIT